MVEENEDAICEAVAKDMRRPRLESITSEVFDMIVHCKYYDKNLQKLVKTMPIPTPINHYPFKNEVRQPN